MGKVTLIKPEKDPDPVATAYRVVRDATLLQSELTNAEKVAVLELVKFELLRNLQSNLDGVSG